MKFSRLLPVVAMVIVLAGAGLLTACQSGNSESTPLPTIAVQTSGQSNAVAVTLATSNLTGGVFSDELVKEFESTHPGIKVSVVKVDANIPPAALGLDQHLKAVQQYASSADVLYVANSDLTGAATARLSVEATRAGYFLDLKPFVVEDKTLNSDDFFPAIWQSYQWDNGIWALPIAADPILLNYSVSAFDKAGLPYPNEKWTLDDLSNAVRQLSVKGADGKVTDPGFDVYGDQQAPLFRGLLSSSLLDTNVIPNTPKFDSPEVTALFEDWLKLDRDGMIGGEVNKAPISFSPAIAIVTRSGGTDTRMTTLLPGGRAMLSVQGFAVSGGTLHPNEAYTLAAWLTTRGDVASNALASTPARKSLYNAQNNAVGVFTLNISPEMQAVIDKAITDAVPLSEMRYMDYLANAYDDVKTKNAANPDIGAALQTAEDQALKNQQLAASRKDTLAMVVATPIPSLNLPSGKIALKVAAVGYSIPNQDQWNKLIDDFTASDPQVGKVFLEKYLDATSLDQLGPPLIKYDCVYAPFNGVIPPRLPRMLNLDPFLDADTTFDKNDMIPSVLAQVTMDNKIWMLPSDIAPNVLRYDADRFAKNGVPEPGTDWTINQFVDALKAFKAEDTGAPGFIPLNTFGAYLFQLIAAYGGNPIDNRTNPPTINFTDPDTVNAIQQVINLAKDGDFKYHALFSTRLDISFQPAPSTITQTTLTAFTLPVPLAKSTSTNTKVTLYPRGSKYAAVTYNLGGFYISATSQNPEACYRFISKAARTPALFAAMPTRRSLLNDPSLVTMQGADTVALYKQIATLLADPNTLPFPGLSVGIDRAQIQLELELFEALDKAIVLNVDLNSALKDAETSAKGFQGCVATLPPLGATTDEQRAYLNGFVDCALKADPAMAPLYSGVKVK